MGEINKAKQKVATQQATATPTTQPAAQSFGPVGPPAPPPARRTIEQIISSKSSGGTGTLKELYDIDGSVGNRELLNMDLASSPVYQQKLKDSKSTEVSGDFQDAKGVKSMKEIQLNRNELPIGMRLNSMLNRLYVNADNRNVSSGQAFLTGFDELLKTADKDDREFILKYGGPDKGGQPLKIDKFKKAAAEQYQRLLNEKNNSNSNQGASAAQSAPTSSTKLKVTKMV